MLGPIGGTLEKAGRGVHSTKVTTVVVLGQTVLANVVVTVAVSMVYLQIARAVVSLCSQASSRSRWKGLSSDLHHFLRGTL
jgi:hypothetical protein